MEVERGAWAEINLDAVANNVREAKRLLKPTTKLCAVVKADAYGHGAVPVASEAVRSGADFFAVALSQEGIELRNAGIDKPILILGPMPIMPGVADNIVRYGLSQAVFDVRRLEILAQAASTAGQKARVHLAVDTGMNRIGVQVDEAADFAKKIVSCPDIELEGIFSHFCSADERDKDFTRLQYERFEKAVRAIEAEGIHIPVKHIANSAGLSELTQYQWDMSRQGITLYGMRPSSAVEGYDACYDSFRPVMTVKTQIGFVKDLPAGRTVGYGRTWTAQRPTRLATVLIGYADGLSRLLSNRGYMIVHGRHAPIVGRICMDQAMLDVTDIPGVEVGDEVIVFGGKELPFEKAAQWAETICYELTCNISKRVPRIYVRDKK
jgi:alanine racemase